jgi:hypothetical protein
MSFEAVSMQMHRQDLVTYSRCHNTANHAEPSQTFIYTNGKHCCEHHFPQLYAVQARGLETSEAVLLNHHSRSKLQPLLTCCKRIEWLVNTS